MAEIHFRGRVEIGADPQRWRPRRGRGIPASGESRSNYLSGRHPGWLVQEISTVLPRTRLRYFSTIDEIPSRTNAGRLRGGMANKQTNILLAQSFTQLKGPPEIFKKIVNLWPRRCS